MAYNSADIAAFKNVWVFCEQRQGKMMPTTFELISEGRKLADELGVELCGILLGDNVDDIAAELGGYGADVVCVEPMLETNPLLGAPNCVITPHTAWTPVETRIRLIDAAADNLDAFLKGNPINQVN